MTSQPETVRSDLLACMHPIQIRNLIRTLFDSAGLLISVNVWFRFRFVTLIIYLLVGFGCKVFSGSVMDSRVSSPDMSSIEVLHTHNDSDSLSSNGFSIVSYSEQSFQNGNADNHFHGNFNLANIHSSCVQDSSIDIPFQLNALALGNIQLKEKLIRSNSMLETQLVNLQSWKDDMLTCKNQLEENLSKANEKIALLEKSTNASKLIEEENVKLCGKLASMVNEKEEFTEKVKALELKIKEMEIALKTQYDVMADKLQTESALTQRYRERCGNFEQQIEEYERKLGPNIAIISDFNGSKLYDGAQQKVKEVQKLEDMLQPEEIFNKNDGEKLCKVMHNCEQLQVGYQGATQLLEIQNEKLASCENDVKMYMEKADHQTARLFATQEQLMDVTRKMRKLQRELNEMKDKKNMEILKNQISSFKKDNPEIKRQAFEELERLKNQWKECEKSSA